MNSVKIATSFGFPHLHGCRVNRKAIGTLTMMFGWRTSPSALCWAFTLDVHVDHHDVFISIFNTSPFLCSYMLLPCLPALILPLQNNTFFLLFCLLYVISFSVIAFPVCPTGSILKPQKWAQKNLFWFPVKIQISFLSVFITGTTLQSDEHTWIFSLSYHRGQPHIESLSKKTVNIRLQ